MEIVAQEIVYKEFMDLIKSGASDKAIADLAFEYLSWCSFENEENLRDIVYDLALLEEPGMEFSREEIIALINQLKK